MKRDVLVNLVETHISEASDVPTGQATFCNQISELVETEGISLQDISLKNLFEALVDRDRTIDLDNPVAVSESMYAAGMPTLVGKLLHPVFIRSYEPLANTALKLVSETTSKKSKETIGGLSAHDAPQLTNEGSPYEGSSPFEKEAVIRNHKFGITVDLTVEAVTEDQTGQIVQKARGIGTKGGTQIHAFIVQKVCDLACTVTGEPAGRSLYINGAARTMYADDHSSWDDYANDNNLASTALSFNGLDAAEQAFASMKDEKGDYIVIMPKFLIVPPALKVTALQLVGSTLEPGTSNNDANVFKGAYEVFSSPFVSASTSWWLGDPTLQTQIQWVWKPKTDTLGGNTQAAFSRDIVSQYKFSYKAGVGSTDYRYVVKGTA